MKKSIQLSKFLCGYNVHSLSLRSLCIIQSLCIFFFTPAISRKFAFASRPILRCSSQVHALGHCGPVSRPGKSFDVHSTHAQSVKGPPGTVYRRVILSRSRQMSVLGSYCPISPKKIISYVQRLCTRCGESTRHLLDKKTGEVLLHNLRLE